MTGRWEHLDVASLSSQSKETSLAGSMLVLVLLTIPLTTGGTITGNFCQGGGTISIDWEIRSFQFQIRQKGQPRFKGGIDAESNSF